MLEQKTEKNFPVVLNPMPSQENIPSGLFPQVQPRAARGGSNTSSSLLQAPL